MIEPSPDDTDTLVLPFVFVPDGVPMPDAVRHFREPIVVRARWERFPTVARADGAPDRGRPDSTVRGEPVRFADHSHDDDDALDVAPMLILSATGAVVAEGTAATLSAQALRLAAVMPKTHPYFLAAAGGVLVFATLAAVAEHLVQMAGDRSAGWPEPLRVHSRRARAQARAVDRDVVDAFEDGEWRAHHLISVQPAGNHLPLLAAAARAGWRMDEPGNVMILPRTRAAQAKLAAAGIRRPLHDNGHPVWNAEVEQILSDTEILLKDTGFSEASAEYASLAYRLLKEIQSQRRIKAMGMDRIVQNQSASGPGRG